MLRSLSIKNFRVLKDFSADGLGAINLIVGKNNSGKSSVLEALRIYAQLASPSLLESLIVDHDEISAGQPNSGINDEYSNPHRNFFFGREFPTDGDSIYIGDNQGANFVEIGHSYFVEEEEQEELFETSNRKRRFVSKKFALEQDQFGQALIVKTSRRDSPKFVDITDAPRRYRSTFTDPLSLPVGFVPTVMTLSEDLANLYDSVTLTNYESIIVDGLKIIEDNIKGLAFVKRGDVYRRNRPNRTPIVKLNGIDQPIPLKSMGDGMMRVLQLLLMLIPARGGLYLADEFENGLHYSVQEQVWDLIFELATTYNTQVFAVTHSWDCIEAFAKVATRRSESASLMRVGRSVRTSDHGKVMSTMFTKHSLSEITQLDVEVR